LFRNDSMATKTSRNYFKMIAPDFLRNALSSLINEVVSNSKGFEVDPKKFQDGDELNKNIANLKNISQRFLDVITQSLDEVPMNMRKFFNLLRQLVRQCFPKSELRAIGSFMFLRLICPAIVAPFGFQLVEELPNPEATRTLLLIAKMIQHLANGLLIFKEDFMLPLDDWLVSNESTMISFLEALSEVPSKGPKDASRPSITREDKIKCLAIVVGQMTKNFSHVEKAIEKDPRANSDDESRQKNQVNFQQLKNILMKGS